MSDNPTISDTLAQREATYGSFADKAVTIQRLKALAAGAPQWDQMASDEREAVEMIFTKIGRLLYGAPDQQDTWHDIAGYAKLVDDRLTKKLTLTEGGKFGDNYTG